MPASKPRVSPRRGWGSAALRGLATDPGRARGSAAPSSAPIAPGTHHRDTCTPSQSIHPPTPELSGELTRALGGKGRSSKPRTRGKEG